MGHHDLELDADACALDRGYYGAVMEDHVRYAIDIQNLDNTNPTHPTARIRITEAIKAAAEDDMTTAQRSAFEARLQECQQLVNGSSLKGEINLLGLWKQAQLDAKLHQPDFTSVGEDKPSWVSRLAAEKPSSRFLS